MRLRQIFYISVLIFFTNYSYAQVTIGSDEQPLRGALLDLKQNPDGTSNKGLLMPRVSLAGITDLTIAENSTESKNQHIGAVVYNVNKIITDEAYLLCPGIYVWNGEAWQRLKPLPKKKTSFDSSTGILTDHEGNTYPTAEFGSAGRWMTVNLRTKTMYDPCGDHTPFSPHTANSYASSQSIQSPNPTDPSLPEYANGTLYNWAAATNKKGGDNGQQNGADEEGTSEGARIQGVCPDGWHLPTDKEWTDFENEIILHTSSYSTTPDIGSGGLLTYTSKNGRGTLHGKAMKDPTQPYTDTNQGTSKPANAGGYAALLAGYARDGSVKNFLGAGCFWSSSSKDNVSSWARIYYNTYSSVFKGYYTRDHLFSVRCKKD